MINAVGSVSRETSEELRLVILAKRKKEISNTNYKAFQENENIMKKQQVQKREHFNFEILEIIKSQVSLVYTQYINYKKLFCRLTKAEWLRHI